MGTSQTRRRNQPFDRSSSANSAVSASSSSSSSSSSSMSFIEFNPQATARVVKQAQRRLERSSSKKTRESSPSDYENEGIFAGCHILLVPTGMDQTQRSIVMGKIVQEAGTVSGTRGAPPLHDALTRNTLTHCISQLPAPILCQWLVKEASTIYARSISAPATSPAVKSWVRALQWEAIAYHTVSWLSESLALRHRCPATAHLIPDMSTAWAQLREEWTAPPAPPPLPSPPPSRMTLFEAPAIPPPLPPPPPTSASSSSSSIASSSLSSLSGVAAKRGGRVGSGSGISVEAAVARVEALRAASMAPNNHTQANEDPKKHRTLPNFLSSKSSAKPLKPASKKAIHSVRDTLKMMKR
eukprot:TRINITY_DN5209_c0_g1_i3.p1 TRINITY_DN5209_c0_g1~~TRINITY_DN5209_c0_g1_i3.p1  ORF type:complete len:355 (-),score=53.85 TRINITY_DN5209_c0_g1_i3:11-1075(-)